MQNYKVTVTERFEKTVSIQADSAEHAIQVISEMWNNDDPLLDSPPFKGVSYNCEGPVA